MSSSPSNTVLRKVRLAVVASAFAFTLAAPSAALAAPTDQVVSGSAEVVATSTTTKTEVLGEQVTPNTQVLDSTVGGLAVTGSDIAGLGAMGLAAVGLGSLLLVSRRRKANAA